MISFRSPQSTGTLHQAERTDFPVSLGEAFPLALRQFLLRPSPNVHRACLLCPAVHMNEERTFKCLPKDTAPAPGAGGDWDPRTQGALRPAPPPCLAPAQFYFYCLSLLDLWPSQQHSPRCQAPWQRPLPGEGDSAQPCQHASGRTLHGRPTGDTQEPHPWTVSSVGHSYPEREKKRTPQTPPPAGAGGARGPSQPRPDSPCGWVLLVCGYGRASRAARGVTALPVFQHALSQRVCLAPPHRRAALC